MNSIEMTSREGEKVVPSLCVSIAKDKSRNRSETKDSKRQRGNKLRAKSVGMLTKIDVAENSDNISQKIIFGDSIQMIENASTKDSIDNEHSRNDVSVANDDDSDIPEIKASEAKLSVLIQMKEEREAVMGLRSLEGKRKRKSSSKQTISVAQMDENFFSQLDADLERERKVKKQARVEPKGKKTVFLLTNQESDFVKSQDNNLAVVVLGTETVAATSTGNKPSKEALLFSRTLLKDGISAVKKSGIKEKKPLKQVGWKRSTKMTRVLIVGRKQRRSNPAVNFGIKVNR
jgi:hypothetical protein